MIKQLLTSIFAYIAFYFVLNMTLSAQCNKDDIEFYLEKGFTQEQITQLCSAGDGEGTGSVPDYTPYQQKVIIYQEGAGPEIDKDGFTREEREAISSLNAGGDVTNLNVTSDVITYTRKVCVFSANGPDFEDRVKACPETDFSISRGNLNVSHSGKKLLLLGTATVQVEGSINRTLKQGFDVYPPDIRKQLERNFNWRENGKITDFPVRGDYSVTRIVNAFRTLASTYKGNVPETDQQVAIVENESSEEELAEKPKKKKRWWNPFD